MSLLFAVVGAVVILACGAWASLHPIESRSARHGRDRASPPVQWLRGLRGAGSRRTGQAIASVVLLALGAALIIAIEWGLGATVKATADSFDRSVLDWFTHHRTPAATHILLPLTAIGAYPVVIAAALVAGSLLLLLERRWLPLLLLVVAVPLEKYLQKWIGLLVDRHAPPAALAIGPPGGFPSGGSARAVVVFGLIAWFATQERIGWRPAVAAWTAAALAAFIEGYSRLYLGRHWTTDMLAGWLLGALILAVLLIAASLLGPTQRRAGRRTTVSVEPGA